MGWSELTGGPGGGGGGTTPSANYTIKPNTGIPSGTVQIKDGTGNILTSLPLGPDGKALYTRQLTTDNIGQQGLGAHYTGDHQFQSRSQDTFTSHIADANGNNATAAQFSGVKQNVAGPGIYISSPNGQGVVTVSTQPLPTKANANTLYDVTWSEITSTAPFGVVGEFIAVGVGGTNMRSRDGHNWVQMVPANQVILGVSVELNSAIPNGAVEYNGVGFAGKSIYGRAGLNGDSMSSVDQLSDQSGAISETLISTFIYPTVAGSGGGGGGGGSTTTSGLFEITWVAAYDSPPSTGRNPYYSPYSGGSESVSISAGIANSLVYYNWPSLFGLPDADYAAGGEFEALEVSATVKFQGSTTILGYTWAISDTSLGFTLGYLQTPINLIPPQPDVPGKIYEENGTPHTIVQGTPYGIEVTLHFTDGASVVHTLVANRAITWV